MDTIENLIKININNNHRTLITTLNLKNYNKIKAIHKFLQSELIKPLEILQVYKKKPTQILDTSTFINQIPFKDTDTVLGNTFDFLILEFDKITPNGLIKVIETIAGGGVIFLLINDFEELKKSLFWNRIFQKLFEKNFSIFLDADCNLKNNVPFPSMNKKIEEVFEFSAKTRCQEIFLKKYILALKTNELRRTNTEAENNEASEETKRQLIFLTADRGRGKSTALGILISYCIFYKTNKIIHVTAPKLENLKTMFSHILRTLKQLDYKEEEIRVSYKHKLICKIEILKSFYQKIEYINPFDENWLIHPDLIIIDEAAAIPIKYLKKLIKCQNIFLSSTVGGYEGTGKSLTLKFMQNLKNILIKKETLNLSIRYANNDPLEAWINEAFLLKENLSNLKNFPSLENCKLFFINKKHLFSNSSKTEAILHNLYSLFINSHYKNSPEDLKLLADNENHLIFSLVFKLKDPFEYKIMVSIHVALENTNEKETEGNLIPNVLNQQYKVNLGNGLRIVRICVHPQFTGLGYGSRALHEIKKLFPLIETLKDNVNINKEILCEDSIFISTENKEFLKVNWIGASMGANKEIINFWIKNDFKPVYLKSQPNKITGENSCIVLNKKYENINKKFKEQFIGKLCFHFKELHINLVYVFLNENKMRLCEEDLALLTSYDLKRLREFNEMFNFVSSILDILPNLARLYFLGLLNISLSILEEMCLISLGLQHKSIFACQNELEIDDFTFCETIRRIIQKFLK